MPTKSPRPPSWQASFLDNLAETALVSRAARYAGVTRQTAYLARSTKNRTGTDLLQAQSFAQMWDAALDQAADSAEIEVRRRAMEGTEHIHDVYRQGQKISTTITHRYSDRLLMFLLERLRPDTYGKPIDKSANQPCNHCGCNPHSQPSPEEVAGRQLIDAYTDRLIARAKAHKTEPKPQPQAVPVPHIPQPETAPINSYSTNQPLFVSTDLSSFPETLSPNSDSSNQPLFVTSDVSSFQKYADELSIEYCPSNATQSLSMEADNTFVGATHGSPLPASSSYLANFKSLNPSAFVSNNLSSLPEVLASNNDSQNLPVYASSVVSSFTLTPLNQPSKYVIINSSFLAPPLSPSHSPPTPLQINNRSYPAD